MTARASDSRRPSTRERSSTTEWPDAIHVLVRARRENGALVDTLRDVSAKSRRIRGGSLLRLWWIGTHGKALEGSIGGHVDRDRLVQQTRDALGDELLAVIDKDAVTCGDGFGPWMLLPAEHVAMMTTEIGSDDDVPDDGPGRALYELRLAAADPRTAKSDRERYWGAIAKLAAAARGRPRRDLEGFALSLLEAVDRCADGECGIAGNAGHKRRSREHIAELMGWTADKVERYLADSSRSYLPVFWKGTPAENR